MNIKTILKRFGIISHSEVQQVVSAAKERFGKLPSSHNLWDGNQLDNEARELLRRCDASAASNRLAAAITATPDAYIQGWTSFCENVETCCQMVSNRLGKLPEAEMRLRVERIKTEVVALLDSMSVAEATNQLIAQIQKRPVIYINGFSAMLAKKHLPLVVAVCERDMGSDWECNGELVKSRLRELFDEEEQPENAIKRMLLDISAGEKSYLKPTIEKAKELAEAAFTQLKHSLLEALPSGASLREEALRTAVERLLIGGTPMKKLVENLMNEIKKSPFDYISMPPRPHSTVDCAQICR